MRAYHRRFRAKARPEPDFSYRSKARFGFVGEGDICDGAPWPEFGGVGGFAGVVLAKALLEVGREADIAFSGTSDALDQVDVEQTALLR